MLFGLLSCLGVLGDQKGYLRHSSDEQRCKMVVFANGGKMGSTTLAMLLKHKFPDYSTWDKYGPFDDAEKEICASSYRGVQTHASNACKQPHRYLLDACPRPITRERLRSLQQEDKSAVVIVFYRPQSSALLSYFNDRASSGIIASGSADAWVRRHWDMPLFNALASYRMAREFFAHRKVVLVETEQMRTDAGVRDILTRIANARGLPKFRSRAIFSNQASSRGSRYNQATISRSTREWVDRKWSKDNRMLCKLSGQCAEWHHEI